jgi:hypothetical protein
MSDAAATTMRTTVPVVGRIFGYRIRDDLERDHDAALEAENASAAAQIVAPDTTVRKHPWTAYRMVRKWRGL